MTTAKESPRVTIVGAGPAGAAMAVLLGRRGWTVRVFERRDDVRGGDDGEGRSINLGLSLRGIRTLAECGVAEPVLAGAVPARGRVIHPVKGDARYQPYGRREDEILWSISRRALSCALIDRAEAMPNVSFHFGRQCIRLEKETGAAEFLCVETSETEMVDADLVVGADGVFSLVRAQMQRGERADYAQEYLPWGYKELRLPASADGRSQVHLEALHVWPRGDCVIVSHPNQDGSHTCTLFLPHEGRTRSFEALATDGDVTDFFRGTFPDLVPLVPDLLEQWNAHPVAALVSTRTSKWHHRDRVVLVGDACHAVYPFYGQGMNAAMEDCLTLDGCLSRHGGDRAAAFADYQKVRKENTDALCELVNRNFVELRQTSGSPVFVWQKKVDFVLNRLFPRRWMPPYTMVVHTTMPYAEALARVDRQARIRRATGIDLLLWLALPFAALALWIGKARSGKARQAAPVIGLARTVETAPAAAVAAVPALKVVGLEDGAEDGRRLAGARARGGEA